MFKFILKVFAVAAAVAAALANVVKVGGDNESVGGSGAQEPDEGEDDAWEGLSEAA